MICEQIAIQNYFDTTLWIVKNKTLSSGIITRCDRIENLEQDERYIS